MTGLSIMLLTGLVLGWVAGSRFAKAARGWRDLRVHNAQVPVLRNLALVLTRGAVGFAVLAVVVGALALYLLATESGH
ncbi:MAG: hypothetical protein ACRDT6_12625 [Micromonosporaceae bacterium]